MTIKTDESILLNESVHLSFDTLIELSGLTHSELHLLVDSGALVPNQTISESHLNTLRFDSHCLISIRKLVRLKQDFEIESNSFGLVLVFLERIRILELQLHDLVNQKTG